MSHEKVSLYLGGLDPQSPYFSYIRERNGTIAKHISRYLGVSYDPAVHMTTSAEKHYFVPGKTIDLAQASLLQIEDASDFYGGTVPDLGMVGKTILHPSASADCPDFYSLSFARTVSEQGLVLPGVTAFNIANLVEAYRQLPPQLRYRLKAANDSDGNGQHIIRDVEHLAEMAAKTGESITQEGAVIEANLHDRQTVSAGIFQIGTDRYAFVANQLNDVAGGRDRYLGAREVTVTRGGLEELIYLPGGDARKKAVLKSALFHRLFLAHYPVTASRISYDILYGDADGVKLSGITDITARLGGTCPALILAAQYLQEHSLAQATVGQVNLNYRPETAMPEEKNAVVFLNAPTLRITAKIDRVL